MSGKYHVIKTSTRREEEESIEKTTCVATNGVKSWCICARAPAGAKVDMEKVDLDEIINVLDEPPSMKAPAKTIRINFDSSGRAVSAAYYVGAIKVGPLTDIADIRGKGGKDAIGDKREKATEADKEDLSDKAGRAVAPHAPARVRGASTMQDSRPTITLAKPYCRLKERPDKSRYYMLMIPEETPCCRDTRGNKEEIAGAIFMAEEGLVRFSGEEGLYEYIIDNMDPIRIYRIDKKSGKIDVDGRKVFVSPIELKSKYETGQALWAQSNEARRGEVAKAVAVASDISGKVCLRGEIARGYRDSGYLPANRRKPSDEGWLFKFPPHTTIDGESYGYATITVDSVRESKHVPGTLCAYFEPDEMIEVQRPRKRRTENKYEKRPPKSIPAGKIVVAIEQARETGKAGHTRSRHRTPSKSTAQKQKEAHLKNATARRWPSRPFHN